MSKQISVRPNCEQILLDYSQWALSISTLYDKDKTGELAKNLKDDVDFDKSYHLFFLKKKWKIFKRNKPSPEENLHLQKNPIPKQNFEIFDFLGEGNFALTFIAKNKLEDRFFTIKQIPIKTDFDMNESEKLKFINSLNDEFIVRFYAYWIDLNYALEDDVENYLIDECNVSKYHPLFKHNRGNILSIKMEFCALSLKEAIKQINNEMCLAKQNNVTILGYFIACALLVEILECVEYLHSQNPTIFHKNLKPTNILLTEKPNGRFVKITDLGDLTMQEFEKYTMKSQVSKTVKYMAPEVIYKQAFSVRSDVYSIGMIIEDLFNLNSEE
jgi:serine/threonine protein kinase